MCSLQAGIGWWNTPVLALEARGPWVQGAGGGMCLNTTPSCIWSEGVVGGSLMGSCRSLLNRNREPLLVFEAREGW